MTLELRLGSEDLKPEYRECSASKTSFDKFNEEAQKQIRYVGKGTYYANGGSNHNVIYPPND